MAGWQSSPVLFLLCAFVSLVRQAKLGGTLRYERRSPRKLIIKHEADRAGGGATRGLKPREASSTSRSASEPESASKHKLGVATVPKIPKPISAMKLLITRNGRPPRGERGRRVSKGNPRNLGDPAAGWSRKQNRRPRIEREEITAKPCPDRESEASIVALKRGNARGAKGRWHE